MKELSIFVTKNINQEKENFFFMQNLQGMISNAEIDILNLAENRPKPKYSIEIWVNQKGRIYIQ